MSVYKCGKCGESGHNRRKCGKTPTSVKTLKPTSFGKKKETSLSTKKTPIASTVGESYEKYKKARVEKTPTLQTDSSSMIGAVTTEEAAHAAATKNMVYSGPEVEYDYATSCATSGCDEEGICRCGVMHNARVENVDVSRVAEKLLNNVRFNAAGVDMKRWMLESSVEDKLDKDGFPTFSDADKKSLEKILTHRVGLDDPYAWDVTTTSGYYGDELDEVVVSDPYALEQTLVEFLDDDSEGRAQQARDAEKEAKVY